ncbi:unnamed protein product, partial [Gadus morhua 'NCC']
MLNSPAISSLPQPEDREKGLMRRPRSPDLALHQDGRGASWLRVPPDGRVDCGGVRVYYLKSPDPSWNATLVAAAIAHDRTGLGVSEGQRPPWDQGLGRDKLVERMYQRTTMG